MKLPKKKHRSIHQLKKELQKLVNRWCRLRDKDEPCISCRKPLPFENSEAGHYVPTTSSTFRFDPRNINKQCFSCNHFKSGNLTLYRIHLVEKIGEDAVKELESSIGKIHKWDRTWLEEQIEYYKNKKYTLIYGHEMES